MRNKVITLFYICCSFFSVLFARENIQIRTISEGYAINPVVANIEATYDFNSPLLFEHFRDSDYIKTEKAIQHYLKIVKDSCDLNEVEEYLYDMIEETSQKEYGEEETIRYATIYLMCGFKNYAYYAYQTMATAYANLQDKDNLRYVLYCFEHDAVNKDGEYDALIAQMRNDMDAILHPKNINSYAQGVWVSNICTNRKKYNSFPYSIIDIRALTDDGMFSLTLPSFDNTLINQKDKFSNFKMAQVVEYDDANIDNPGRMSAIFSSQYFQQGINTSSGFEQTRRFQADMQGKIAASRGSFGQQIGATAATTAVAGLMNMALLAAAQSYQTVATMTIDMQPVTEDFMTGRMKYIYHTFSTSNPNEDIDPIYDDKIDFFRWLPEDGIYFVNSREEIYSLTAKENLDLTEYQHIRHKQDMIRAFVSGGAVVGGAGLIAGGAALMATSHNTGGMVGGAFMLVGGIVGGILTPVFVMEMRSIKPYDQLNNKQLNKLRNKRGSTISVSPAINPFSASAEISVGVKY